MLVCASEMAARCLCVRESFDFYFCFYFRALLVYVVFSLPPQFACTLAVVAVAFGAACPCHYLDFFFPLSSGSNSHTLSHKWRLIYQFVVCQRNSLFDCSLHFFCRFPLRPRPLGLFHEVCLLLSGLNLLFICHQRHRSVSVSVALPLCRCIGSSIGSHEILFGSPLPLFPLSGRFWCFGNWSQIAYWNGCNVDWSIEWLVVFKPWTFSFISISEVRIWSLHSKFNNHNLSSYLLCLL